jgi:hypothetical protein
MVLRPSPSRAAPSWPRIAIVAAAIVAGSASAIVWSLRLHGSIPLFSTAATFAAFVALGDQLEIALARGGAFSLGLAPALGFAMYRDCATVREHLCASWTGPPLGEIAAVFIAGGIGSMALRALRRRELRPVTLSARLLVVMGGAAAYRGVISVTPELRTFGLSGMSLLGLAAVIVAVGVLDVSLRSVMSLAEERLPLRQIVRDNARATGPLLISTISVAALLALAYPSLDAWTLPLFLAPLAATEFSFRQVASVRKNYLQTIRALSKVPEMAGYTVRGHSTRVAQLSVEIAKELGIGDPSLHEIEYAALLHDIGNISLPDPEEDTKSLSSLQLALVGGEIIEETGHFPAVAQMVRQQNEQYRRRGEDINRTLSIGSKIVKVASAYDDLTSPPGPGRSSWDALERLHLGMAYEYDPAVIQALTRVLEKNGLI